MIAALKELEIIKGDLSQHLRILRSVGVVETERRGKEIYCSLVPPEVKTACGLMREDLRRQTELSQMIHSY